MDPSIDGATPPISKLTNDILCFIFSINADMTDESLQDHNKLLCRALHVTRRTSQVSRYWRTLILESPTIWAGVIDLELFRPSLENWREEVFRRCGGCLLSVKGVCSFAPEFTDTDALIKFFDTYWDQIKNLHVEVTYADQVDGEIWLKILCRPARFLCSLNLQFQQFPPPFPGFHNPGATWFPDIAPASPALRRFYHHPMTYISSLRTPWLSQLRVLELKFMSTRRPRATTIWVLDSLENLHILEVLKISMRCPSPEPRPNKRLRSIKLPRLHRLSFDCEELDDSIYFLEHIIPQQKCALSLYSDRSFADEPPQKYLDKFASLAEHFSVYAQALSWDDAQVLSLTLSSHSFAITIYGESWKDNSDFLHSSDNSHLKLKITPTNHTWPGDIVDFLPFLRSIPSSLLGVIKVFDLDIRHNNCFTPAPRPIFHDFLASLRSVESLIAANNYTIFSLLESASKSSAFFPSLHTLKMRQLKIYKVPAIHTIMDFLRWRIKAGHAIEVLDLTLAQDAHMHQFMSLEEMTGLKVGWRFQGEPVHEYICGTGSPEKLDLQDKSDEGRPYGDESQKKKLWEDDS